MLTTQNVLEFNSEQAGNEAYSLMQKLFPLCRSITGKAFRESLQVLKSFFPLTMHEIPSGSEVFDWTVPKEWNIRDAYIKNSSGKKIIDFQKNNLHVVSYSQPIHKKMSLDELKPHLHTLPEFPDWIPYHTSYYKDNWGFCLSHHQFSQLENDTYEVVIDSSLENGVLNYGEFFLQGKVSDEVLISSYLCHPSMCNDNLSGPVVLTALASYLKSCDLHYSYRFIIIPETIGAIAWLNRNEQSIKKIKHGLIATCCGDSGHLTFKKTRQGNTEIDRIAIKILKDSNCKYEILDFFPSGSDERQFCSPGFDLPVGSLMRTPYARFPEYHTSADNLDFVQPKFLGDTIEKYLHVIFVLESNFKLESQFQKCEPQLSKRGLYSDLGGIKKHAINKQAIQWVLNLSDGKNSLLDIAERSNLKFMDVKMAADVLLSHGILKAD